MTGRTQDNQGDDEADRRGEPSLSDKVAYLSSAAAYGETGEVEAIETRMAWVFLAGDRVYKLKKPVRQPHLDYRTLDARQWACEEEVRLNRRLAGDVYLGLVRLTRERDGTFALDGAGEVVDWLVRMRRLPRARLLDNAIDAGTVSRQAIERVADMLVDFYRETEWVAVDPADRVDALAGEIGKGREILADARFEQLAGRGGAVLDALAELLGRDPGIVTARIEAGRVVEGHGDLKPEHVCLTDPPVIIDCLEFSRELRLVDPFDELSYLSMECAVLGASWIGPLLVERCAEGLDDRPPERTLAFYRAYRATLRARQSLEHLLEPKPRTPEKWLPKAEAYFAAAEDALVSLRPRGGRPASRPRGDAV